MGRRDKGSGSVSVRPNGTYRLRCYLGKDPVTGRPKYRSRDIQAKNITEARKLLAKFVLEQQDQTLGTDATVRTLMAEWLEQITSSGRSPRTIHSAERCIETLINPTLGDVPLSKLTPRHIDQMNRKTSHLAPSTRRRHHDVLAAALNRAVKWGWIDFNPAIRADVPKLVEVTAKWPTRAEVIRLIDALPKEMWRMAVRLAVMTGARRGELCALRWTDIDPEAIHIRRSVYRHKGETIEKSTKGGKERQIVMVPEAFAIIEAWAQECARRAAKAGVTVAADGFVLSKWPDCSQPINPDTLSVYVTRAAKGLGMDHVHLHGVRHLAATEMLAQGINVRDAAEALGHADGGRLILKVYGHPTSDRQRAAASAMAAALTPPALEAAP